MIGEVKFESKIPLGIMTLSFGESPIRFTKL
jgi:hypothetical protein